MKTELERFMEWVRDGSRGCLDEQEQVDLSTGEDEEDDDDSPREFVFKDAGVQAQWEAWRAASKPYSWLVIDLRNGWLDGFYKGNNFSAGRMEEIASYWKAKIGHTDVVVAHCRERNGAKIGDRCKLQQLWR